MASNYGNRVAIGRHLIDSLGDGFEKPEAMIDDTVLKKLIRDRLSYGREADDDRASKAELREENDFAKLLKDNDNSYNKVIEDYSDTSLPYNTVDPERLLSGISMGDGIIRSMANEEEVNIPDDPEADRVVDEANLAEGSDILGKPRAKLSSEDERIREITRRMALKNKEAKQKLKDNNKLLDMQLEGLSFDQAKLVNEDEKDVKQWDARVRKNLSKDSRKRDKDFKLKDLKAKKLIAYADDPDNFHETWYKEHPVHAKRKLPDGTVERREIIFNEDNPDPDLEGVDLVKYADAMNEKFPALSKNPMFSEYDYGPEDIAGEPLNYPADPLEAAATGKPYEEPSRLQFPEMVNPSEGDNRLGMVRRMLYGELGDDELKYLMELMDKDRHYAKGGYVNDKAFKTLQMIYGPNHPALSDKRFKNIISAVRRTL
jgi:hypothetical protein